MRVTRDRQKFSVAALLLCLIAAFAISPPDYFRTQNRSRASRTLRLDDHDHDYALDTEALSSDLSDTHPGAGPDLLAVLTTALRAEPVWNGSQALAARQSPHPLASFPRTARGRAPPVSL
jgi:hypothetical protein